MAINDRIRDFWDRISPRERTMVVVLAFAVPLGVALWLGFAIRDGLVAMEDRNEQTRKAIDVIADLKLRGTAQQPAEDAVKIPDEPLALETYVSRAAEKQSLKFKGAIDTRQKATHNGFVTNTVGCALDNITTDQLKTFLAELEQSKVVFVTHLEVRRDFSDKKKFDATFEISTYANAPKASGSGAGSGSGDADEKRGS
jgi:hypothetical protein